MSDEIDRIPQIPATASVIAPGTPDRNGVPFDPARHISKKHPVTGRWMPRGGRKPKPVIASSGSPSSPQESTEAGTAARLPTSSPSLAVSPGATVTADALVDLPTRSASAPIPEIGPGEVAPVVKPSEGVETHEPLPALPTPPAPRPPEASGSPESDAEVACQSLYLVTGMITGHQAEAKPTAPEHAQLKTTAAAYLKSRGWVSVGGWAVAFGLLAYFIGVFSKEKSNGTLKGWLSKLKSDRARVVSPEPSAPTPPAADPTPEPAPASNEPRPVWELQ